MCNQMRRQAPMEGAGTNLDVVVSKGLERRIENASTLRAPQATLTCGLLRPCRRLPPSFA